MSSVECRNGIDVLSPEIQELPLESTFPLRPEINFRRQNAELPLNHPERMTEAQLEYYQRENLICFLCEFAGKVPFKSVPGIINEQGELRICNLDVVKLAENSIQVADSEWRPRLQSEAAGWKQALNAINRSGANVTHIISPPLIADYSLALSVHVQDYDPILRGRPVQQVITRFSEEMGTLSESRRRFDILARAAQDPTLGGQFEVPEDFLEHPICKFSASEDPVLETVKLLGLSDEEIMYSKQYEEEVRMSLQPMIQSYLLLVDEASKYNPEGTYEEQLRYEHAQNMLEVELNTIFSFAKRIATEIRGSIDRVPASDLSVQEIVALHESDRQRYYQYVDIIMHQEPPMITGGTQCPSVNALGLFSQVATDGRSLSIEQYFHSVLNPNSSFWESLRGPEKKYKFDKQGTCQGCARSHREVGLLGPCHVCRHCQAEFDSGKRK